jgi:putative ABC transport system permease protein
MKRSLRSWLWRVPLDQEVDEELAFHIEMRTRELVDKGLDAKVAREVVLARIGDAGRLRRTCIDLGRKRDRHMRVTQWLGELRDDVKFAFRQLKSAPGFTLVAVITLALGIGANSAMFALADVTLLRPLPFADPERLVLVWEKGATYSRGRVAPLNFTDWNERNHTFDAMAAFQPGNGFGPVMTGADATPEVVPRQMVSARFFDVLGIKPVLGRTFLSSDEGPTTDVIVLGEEFWRTRFGADPAVIGRAIRFGGGPYTVIGVVRMPFHFGLPSSVWMLYPRSRGFDGRSLHFVQVVGRLKPGATLDAADRDLSAIANDLARDFPATNKGRGIAIEPLRDGLIGSELNVTALLFLAVVGFVLLMCCANVANLLLARATARARELAVRSAIGAGRRRIMAQLLTESLVLAALGGLFGAIVGAGILKVAPAVVPQGLLPGDLTLTLDPRVLVFCAMTTLVVGVSFGSLPAWQATRSSLLQTMTSEGRTTTGRSSRFQRLLVVGEVATAVLLLCGAGLLLRTLLAIESVESGYGADNVLTMSVSVPVPTAGSRYPTEDAVRQFHDGIERDVAALPGVKSAAWASTLPFGPMQIGGFPFQIIGDAPLPDDRRLDANYQIVSPSYFETVDLPIVAGRGFTDADDNGSVPVCIVNEAFVRRYLQGRDPIGMQIAIRPMTFRPAQAVVRQIVGIARQVKGRPDEAAEFLQVYVPRGQNTWSDAFLLVRPTGDRAASLAPIVRRTIGRADANATVMFVRTLDEVAYEATSRHRFRAVMVVTFAALALVLAMVGVFGVIAYSVQQRTREFGVRIALGATTRSVLGLVLGSAARVIGAGVIVGLALAMAFAQAISTFLFGVQPRDPLTFVAVPIVLVLTALAACAAPALRAARVDPVVAFRSE